MSEFRTGIRSESPVHLVFAVGLRLVEVDGGNEVLRGRPQVAPS